MTGTSRPAGTNGTARLLPPTRGLQSATRSSLGQFWAERLDALKRHIESPGDRAGHDTTEPATGFEENQA